MEAVHWIFWPTVTSAKVPELTARVEQRERGAEWGRETERQRERHSEAQREWQRETDREWQREAERESGRERQSEAEREAEVQVQWGRGREVGREAAVAPAGAGEGSQATLAAQSTTQNSSKRASYADGSWGQDGWISCPIECTYIEQPKRLLNERVQAAPRRPTLGVQLRDGQHQPSNDLMVMMGPQLNQMHGLHGACSDGMALLNALLSVETADECAEEEV